MKPLYQELAQLVDARLRCLADNNPWAERHDSRIEALCVEYMPHGSGFDNGTMLDLEASTGNKLVFNTSYHYMDEFGSYAGWTEHRVIVRPDLQFGFTLRITGSDRNYFKEYACEVFEYALRTEV